VGGVAVTRGIEIEGIEGMGTRGIEIDDVGGLTGLRSGGGGAAILPGWGGGAGPHGRDPYSVMDMATFDMDHECIACDHDECIDGECDHMVTGFSIGEDHCLLPRFESKRGNIRTARVQSLKGKTAALSRYIDLEQTTPPNFTTTSTRIYTNSTTRLLHAQHTDASGEKINYVLNPVNRYQPLALSQKIITDNTFSTIISFMYAGTSNEVALKRVEVMSYLDAPEDPEDDAAEDPADDEVPAEDPEDDAAEVPLQKSGKRVSGYCVRVMDITNGVRLGKPLVAKNNRLQLQSVSISKHKLPLSASIIEVQVQVLKLKKKTDTTGKCVINGCHLVY
jgi:hypothetical protein